MLFRLLPVFITALYLPAATVVDVGPASGVISLGTNEALVASFTLADPLNNVAMTADVTCISCSATLYLMRNSIGASATAGDLWLSSPISGPSLFANENLLAGTYHAVIANTGGALLWGTASAPVITEALGGTRDFDYAQNVYNASFPPASNFQLLLPDVLVYTVTATAVPEPSSVFLALGAVAFLVVQHIRRSDPAAGRRV